MAQRLTAQWLVAISRARDLFDSYWLSRTPTLAGTHNDAIPARRPDSYVHKLPPEILYEILKYLEWRDLLNASSTCRIWHTVTQSRQLWITLATDLQAIHGIVKMEEPTGDYTTAELREWVLRRLRIQDAWKDNTNALNFQPRRFDLPGQERVILIPGGRWLLATDDSGRLFSYDLDSPEGKPPRLLVDPNQRDEKLEGLFQLSYWIDSSRQKLTLRVALWQFDADDNDVNFTSTYIYQVDLLGHGEDAYLDAQLLSAVKANMETNNLAVALDGDYLLECWMPESDDGAQLSLLNYTNGGTGCLERSDPIHSKLAAPNIPAGLHITPTGHVILFGRHHVDIYTLQQLQDDDTATRMSLSPVHRISCHAIIHCSPPFISEDTWLVSGHDGKIHLTRMPQLGGGNDSFVTTTLCEHDLYNDVDHRVLLTAVASLFLHNDWAMDLVLYSWDSNMNTSYSSRCIYIPNLEDTYGTPFHQLFIKAIEKGIGRIILNAHGHDHFFVLDVIP